MDIMTRLQSNPFHSWAQMSDAQKFERIRIERNQLLDACDWTQLPDASLTDEQRAVWAQYRQDLRDLPQKYASPDDVIFPDKP